MCFEKTLGRLAEVYKNREEMAARGCQADGIGVGSGISQAEGHVVVAGRTDKSLPFLNPLMESVCHVSGMVLVMLGPKYSKNPNYQMMLMKGKV